MPKTIEKIAVAGTVRSQHLLFSNIDLDRQKQNVSGARTRFLFMLAYSALECGVATRTAKWARELISRGASVQVVLWRDRARGYNRRGDSIEFQGIDCQQVTFNSYDKKAIVSKEVSRQLQVKAGDVVVATALYDPYCDFIVGLRQTGEPILYVQNVVCDVPNSYISLGRFLPMCDLVVTVSERITRTALQNATNAGHSVQVITCPPGAIVACRPEQRECPAEFRVCFVGRVQPKAKRVFDLVRVMKVLKAYHAHVHLTVVGDGESKMDLERGFLNEQLADRVSFTGWVSHEKVLELLKEQHALLLPSAHEGFSGALCEAMAAGVVPVATRISGSEEAITDGHDGFLVQVGDCEAMADRILNLANDPLLHLRLSENAWRTALKKYSVSASIDRLLKHVARACNFPTASAVPVAGRQQWLSLESSLVPNFVTHRLRQFRHTMSQRLPRWVLHSYRKLRYPALRNK